MDGCLGINFIDVDETETVEHERNGKGAEVGKATKPGRRYWLVSSDLNLRQPEKQIEDENDKDQRLKGKITTLVEQTVHDTEAKITSVEHLKALHRDEAPYKTGFILSMIKKSKDVLNELFNVAVRHRGDWVALEQLKVFELIVHTNVDTTNLVRQLVEIHVHHMNSTNRDEARKRVVLLK